MYKIKQLKNIKTEIAVPADKSISHRAVILSSLCRTETLIEPFAGSDDVLTTVDCVKRLGAHVRIRKQSLYVRGSGLYFSPAGKKRPLKLCAGNSGTTMRILTGLLCCQKFPVVFEAKKQLSQRPMARIVEPLKRMGAQIQGSIKAAKHTIYDDVYPPLRMKPVPMIKGWHFKLAIASAQIKSALMLAALYAKAPTSICEPYMSRDHTERMLTLFGANIKTKGTTITCQPVTRLCSPKRLFVPGDFSSAAFFVVLGLLLKNSVITVKDVNLNPTRCGLLQVLIRMGADIRIKNIIDDYEPYGDIEVRSSALNATIVMPSEIPLLIDEVPILCVAASFAKGKTEIRGVRELKVKETDRIQSMLNNLRSAGVDIRDDARSSDHTIVVGGSTRHTAATFDSCGDHRTAMSMIVFGMASTGQSQINDTVCINKSFPTFISLVKNLSQCV